MTTGVFPKTVMEFDERFGDEAGCRMFLMTTLRNGLSASMLARHIGVSYPTAWTWLHKLRQAMVDPNRNSLSGRVEVDETYVGDDPERSPVIPGTSVSKPV